jgi:drug/metabolite transporter (DMT)-like permease
MFIELALRSFSPSQVGVGRLIVGALVLVGLCAAMRTWPKLTWRQTGVLLLVGLCLSGAPFVLFPLAQQYITSILASLLNAATPLWTALFVALLIPTERATRMQILGLGIGVVGIAVLLGAWNVREFPLLGGGLILLATAFYGVGTAISRRLLQNNTMTSTALVTAQIALSIPLVLPFALMDPAPASGAFALNSVALWGLIGLGVLGTSFAYVLFWKVVRVKGATTAASVTYLAPVIATLLGIAVLGEKLHWYEPVGAVIVLSGVWLAQRRARAKPANTSSEAIDPVLDAAIPDAATKP